MKWEKRVNIYICIYGYIFIYYMMIFIPLHQLKNTQNYFSFCYFPFYNFHIQKIPTNQINFSYVSYFMFLFSMQSSCLMVKMFHLFCNSFNSIFHIFMKIYIILFCINLLIIKYIYIYVAKQSVEMNLIDMHFINKIIKFLNLRS